MITVCPVCRAQVQQRIYINLPADPVAFSEAYECGAIYVWGMVEDGPVKVRGCTRPNPEREAAP